MLLCKKCLCNFKDKYLERNECPICGVKGLKHYDFHLDYIEYDRAFREEMCALQERLTSASGYTKFEDTINDYLEVVKEEYNFWRNPKYYNMFIDQYNREFKSMIFNILLEHFFDLLSEDKVDNVDLYAEVLCDSNITSLVSIQWTMTDLLNVVDILGKVKTVEEVLNKVGE